MNPIENVWAILKAEIYKQLLELINAPNTAATLELLIQSAIIIWDILGVELLNRFLDSMCYSRDAVIEANRWYTKY